MVDIQDLVEMYRQKVSVAQEAEKYKTEVVEPQVLQVFNETFMGTFKNIIDALNQNFGSTIVKFKLEGKSRFSIDGRFHRIIFQKGKTEIIDNMVNANIIPLCIWKGVTKHLGPISFVKDLESGKIEWDLPVDSVEDYTKKILGKLAEDEDFYM